MSHQPNPSARRVSRTATATAVGTLLTTGLLLGSPDPASAHVRVVPDTTTPGSYALLTFRVPNEDPKAVTTKLTLTLPTGDPFPAVSVQPLAGWDATVTEAALPKPVTDDGATLTRAPHTVTWTAQKGQGIAADQLQLFAISVGPLPASGTVLIPATQTYSDGTVVTWDQPTPAGGAEPEHPAQTFTVGPAAAGANAAATPSTGPTVTASPTTDTAVSAAQPVAQGAAVSPTDGTARWLGGAGLFVGVIGLVVGALGLTAARRRQPR
jgi:uncharacterized protein YcnI